ncbi:MAG TPA: hypothetical protein VGD56_20745 [Gemmatirosa sp.]
MTTRRVGRGVVGAALVAAACHRAAPATTPLPTPPGAPPEVQAPVGAAPVAEATVTATVNSPNPQQRRFDVVAVEDTTFTILIGADRWVRPGTVGVAVDPKRRDALVAKFRVLSRLGDSATALITGQTTRVSTTDVALIREPVRGPLRQTVFWGGMFVGLAIGAGTALVIRH